MGHEFDFMASELEAHAKICSDSYAGFDADIDLCTSKAIPTKFICFVIERAQVLTIAE